MMSVRKLIYCVIFNGVVGIIGLVSLVIMVFVGNSFVPPGEDFVEPLAMLAGTLFFGLLANVALFTGFLDLDDQGFQLHFRQVLKWFAPLATAPIWIALLSLVLNRAQ